MRYLHRPFAYRALPVVANSDNDNQGSQSHDYCTRPLQQSPSSLAVNHALGFAAWLVQEPSIRLASILHLPSYFIKHISLQPSHINHLTSSILHRSAHQPSAIIHQPSIIFHHTSCIISLPPYPSTRFPLSLPPEHTSHTEHQQ
ncbi:hypothetical protein SAMN04487901_10699 [Prevotella communis]|uniref:Uncharacterized protein n=1 Tax=Prevotella communis TaxID=2913614 RepID=A0A1H0KT08_9BACT|nr:hypothetical protein SAMN04487901_10699 [Prevotella communis]SDO59079.1 hypothetical protein SAMN04487900_1306 [Prevotella communis]